MRQLVTFIILTLFQITKVVTYEYVRLHAVDQFTGCPYLGNSHSLVDLGHDSMSASVQVWMFLIILILAGVEL